MKPTNRLLIRLLVLVLFACSFVFAQRTVHVRTYTRKDGTVVAAHNRAAPGTASNTRTTSSDRSTGSKSTNTRSSSSDIKVFSTSRPRTIGIKRDINGRIKRSESAKHEFMILHPCPVTRRSSGGCPGYVIDHIAPLACGGADAPSNMQWQTQEAAKAKDKWERKGCR